MKELSLNEVLRYPLAGGATVFFVIVGFAEPGSLIPKSGNGFALLTTSAIFACSLLIGSGIYSIHRALPYPFLYWLISGLIGRGWSIISLDLERWRRLRVTGSLQSHFQEWAAQIHLLYCLSWAIALSRLIGCFADWTPTASLPACRAWLVFLFLLVGAIVHHVHYSITEKSAFADNGDVEQGATPNGGPATPVGNSGVTEGPPSVS